MSYIEVFRDCDSNSQITDEVMSGIDIVKAVLPSLNVISTDKTFKITEQSTSSIDYDCSVASPPTSANFSLIITDRPIYSSVGQFDIGDIYFDYNNRYKDRKRHERAAGLAIRNDLGGIAIVSTFRCSNTAETVAHEIAHLYGLKQIGDKYDFIQKGHCIDKRCIMYYKVEIDSPSSLVAKKNMLLKLFGLQVVGMSLGSLASDFCDDCKSELAIQSINLSGLHELYFKTQRTRNSN